MKKWAIIGAAGQLGKAFTELVKDEGVPLTHVNFEITNPEAIKSLSKHDLRGVINCSAYNLVDNAEDDPVGAFSVNAFSVANLAKFCQERALDFVHYSTNYVFNGSKGKAYTEEDVPSPQGIYACSKLSGEYLANTHCKKSYVIRTAAVFGQGGNKSKGGNFIDRMTTRAKQGQPLKIVNDQTVNPTYAHDLAVASLKLIEKQKYGLYHITNSGETTWAEYARYFIKLAGIKAEITPVASSEVLSKANRPTYGVLDISKFEKTTGYRMRSWQDAVKDYIALIESQL